jgi:hypothetical protein
MDHVYVFGDRPQDEGNGQMEDLEFKEKSPLNYQVKGAVNKYTVFTVPQNVNTNYWEYNGQEPVFQNLGFMPAFISSPQGGEIVYTRFYRVYLPSYIITGVILCFMIFLYSRYRQRKSNRVNEPR